LLFFVAGDILYVVRARVQDVAILGDCATAHKFTAEGQCTISAKLFDNETNSRTVTAEAIAPFASAIQPRQKQDEKESFTLIGKFQLDHFGGDRGVGGQLLSKFDERCNFAAE